MHTKMVIQPLHPPHYRLKAGVVGFLEPPNPGREAGILDLSLGRRLE
jgi:hypothetical protein